MSNEYRKTYRPVLNLSFVSKMNNNVEVEGSRRKKRKSIPTIPSSQRTKKCHPTETALFKIHNDVISHVQVGKGFRHSFVAFRSARSLWHHWSPDSAPSFGQIFWNYACYWIHFHQKRARSLGLPRFRFLALFSSLPTRLCSAPSFKGTRPTITCMKMANSCVSPSRWTTLHSVFSIFRSVLTLLKTRRWNLTQAKPSFSSLVTNSKVRSSCHCFPASCWGGGRGHAVSKFGKAP